MHAGTACGLRKATETFWEITMDLPHPQCAARAPFELIALLHWRSLRVHVPVPPEVDPNLDPNTPSPNIDPDPLPDDLPDDPQPPAGDPPASPPPMQAAHPQN